MEWWDRVAFKLRRAWIDVATSLGIRKNGMRRLGKEVRTCEYEDVRVMWEMLNGGKAISERRRKQQLWKGVAEWARRGARVNLCGSF